MLFRIANWSLAAQTVRITTSNVDDAKNITNWHSNTTWRSTYKLKTLYKIIITERVLVLSSSLHFRVNGIAISRVIYVSLRLQPYCSPRIRNLAFSLILPVPSFPNHPWRWLNNSINFCHLIYHLSCFCVTDSTFIFILFIYYCSSQFAAVLIIGGFCVFPHLDQLLLHGGWLFNVVGFNLIKYRIAFKNVLLIYLLYIIFLYYQLEDIVLNHLSIFTKTHALVIWL